MRLHPDIYSLLETLGLPVFIQGDMPEEMEYPETFITYIWVSSSDLWRFNNRATATNYVAQVTVYSCYPNAIDENIEKVITLLESAGYSKDDSGRMIPSDEPTHLGWTIDFNYIVKE